MGGTDFIDNPGPYPRHGARPPLTPLSEAGGGVSREATVQAYAARLDALKQFEEAAAAEAEAASARAEAAAKASRPVQPPAGRSSPFEPIREPLYPQVPAAAGDTAIRTPRWRGG